MRSGDNQTLHVHDHARRHWWDSLCAVGGVMTGIPVSILSMLDSACRWDIVWCVA